jgi:hypothetical protein
VYAAVRSRPKTKNANKGVEMNGKVGQRISKKSQRLQIPDASLM